MVQNKNNKNQNKKHTDNLSRPAFWHPLKKAMPIALIAATIMSGAAWANSQVKSIDFEPGMRGLDIVVNGSEKVPVKKVFVSNKKLVLDLDHVNATQDIKTNFSQMGSISHVVLQPLSKDKIRLIVRGEDLGRPRISFNDGGYKPSVKEQMPYPMMDNETEEIKPIAEELEEELAEETNSTDEDASSDSGKDLLEDDGDWISDAESSLEKAANDKDVTEQTTGEDFILPAVEVEDTPLSFEDNSNTSNSLSLDGEAPIRVAESNDWTDSMGFISQIEMADLIKYGVLFLLLIGLGVFIKNKASALQGSGNRQNSFQSNRFNPNQTQGFDGFSQGQGQDYSYQQASQMIGLGRLRSQDLVTDSVNPVPQPRFPQEVQPKPQRKPMPQSPSTLSGLTALKKSKMKPKAKPMKTSPAGKQVLNQYQKQAQPTLGRQQAAKRNPLPPKTRNTNTDILRQEMNRSREVQRQMLGNKMPQQGAVQNVGKQNASMKQSSINARNLKKQGDEPLPGNPQVLDFLKDVADLMEKEGKTNIAQTIHKNMHLQ